MAVGIATDNLLSISSRLDQLEAGVGDLLAKTFGLTFYPHQESVPKATGTPDTPVNPSVTERVNQLIDKVYELNLRVDRINDVVGGSL